MRARVRTARAVRQRVSLSLSHPYPNPYPYSGILSPPSFSAVFFRPLFLLLILILILIPPFFLRRSLSARCLFRILILTLILVPHVSVGSGRHFAREFLGGRRWRWVRWTRHRSFHRVACKATLFHRGDELSTSKQNSSLPRHQTFSPPYAAGSAARRVSFSTRLGCSARSAEAEWSKMSCKSCPQHLTSRRISLLSSKR